MLIAPEVAVAAPVKTVPPRPPTPPVPPLPVDAPPLLSLPAPSTSTSPALPPSPPVEPAAVLRPVEALASVLLEMLPTLVEVIVIELEFIAANANIGVQSAAAVAIAEIFANLFIFFLNYLI